jgi:hypothetical protein
VLSFVCHVLHCAHNDSLFRGDNLPVTEYMSRAEFETIDCNQQGYAQPAGRPDLPAPVWGTQQTIKPSYPVIQLPENVEMPKSGCGVACSY